MGTETQLPLIKCRVGDEPPALHFHCPPVVSATAVALAAVAVLVAGCAGPRQAGPGPAVIAVLPLDAVGKPAREAAPRARGAMHEHLSGQPSTRVVPAAAVDRALVGIPACHGQDRQAEGCAGAVGRAVGASHVVSGGLGGLGKTYILQLKVTDVGRSAVTRSLEETLYGGAADLDGAVRRGMNRLFHRSSRAHPPWYRRWWIWAAVGAAVATAVIVPVAVYEDDPYENVELP